MALIRYAEGQQRSGSVGGSVYSHNRFGQYVRARSIPVNPQSPGQVAARNRLQALASSWGSVLTPAQRDAWELYADNTNWQNKFGDSVNLTGVNMYVRSNAAVLQAGGTRVDDAPTDFGLAVAEQNLIVTGSEGTQVLSVAFDTGADWVGEDDAHQLLFMGAPQNPSINFFGGPYRFVEAIAGDAVTPPTSPHACAAGNTPFPFAEGQKIWFRTRVLRADGRLSTFALASFLAGA